MALAAFTRRNTANDVSAIVDHFLGMKSTNTAGETLNDDRCFFIKKNAHIRPPLTDQRGFVGTRGLNRLLCGFSERVCSDEVDIRVGQDLAALFDIGTGQAHHDRHLHLQFLHRLNHAFRNPVAAVNAGKNVHQNCIDALIGQDQVKRLGDPLR